MRLSLIVTAGTWLSAFVLRELFAVYGETVENRQHTPSPPLGWLKATGPASLHVPAVSAVIVLLIVCAIVLLWWRLRLTRLAAIGLGLFCGGAAANLTEQIMFGRVTDYIPISWPDDYLLNFPDIAVGAGGVLMAIAMVCSLTGDRADHLRR